MKQEIQHLAEQLKDAYEGDPWFGRNAKLLLSEADEQKAVVQLNGQHSILELVWHMITWRQFTLHCLQPTPGRNLHHFEQLDWRDVDHNNASLWQEGLAKLDETQAGLIMALQQQDDSLLAKPVPERSYDFRKLIEGIVQHDIYHLGQIAFITKALR